MWEKYPSTKTVHGGDNQEMKNVETAFNENQQAVTHTKGLIDWIDNKIAENNAKIQTEFANRCAASQKFFYFMKQVKIT